LPFDASLIRHVVEPPFEPSLWIVSVTARPEVAGTTFDTWVENGPTPDSASLAATASPTTASTIATKTVP
jgi:hypothetical protein